VYFDSLTIVSMIIFAIAFGSFIYACIIRGCITDSDVSAQDERKPKGKDKEGRGKGE
jgi:hypothetical protein